MNNLRSSSHFEAKNTDSGKRNFEELPQDLYPTITKFLDPRDSASLLRTSKFLHESKERILTIEVQNRNFNDADLEKMTKVYPNLKHLGLNVTKITNQGLQHLSTLTNLTSLNLKHTKITDQGLAHLRTLANLTSLELELCTNITDQGLAMLKEMASQDIKEAKDSDSNNETRPSAP